MRVEQRCRVMLNVLKILLLSYWVRGNKSLRRAWEVPSIRTLDIEDLTSLRRRICVKCLPYTSTYYHAQQILHHNVRSTLIFTLTFSARMGLDDAWSRKTLRRNEAYFQFNDRGRTYHCLIWTTTEIYLSQ